jgi:hypothetical protein
VCNGLRGLKWVQTCIALDCEVWCVVLGLKLMKMCNKKQYIYFICTFMCMFYRSLFFLFLLAIRGFFLTNKNIPHPPKVKWSNIEYSIKFFFPREVRDKNKESSIYTQNSLIVDICLILLYLTKYGHCSKKSLKIPNFWRVGYIFVCKKKASNLIEKI